MNNIPTAQEVRNLLKKAEDDEHVAHAASFVQIMLEERTFALKLPTWPSMSIQTRQILESKGFVFVEKDGDTYMTTT